MGRRTDRRRTDFAGGVDAWVAPDEVATLRDELANVTNADSLYRWSSESSLAPLLPSGAGRSFSHAWWIAKRAQLTGIPIDVDKVLRWSVLDLARLRRLNAVVEWAESRRRSVPAALVTLGRCPACDEPIDLRAERHSIYCREHLDDQAADVDRLLKAVE